MSSSPTQIKQLKKVKYSSLSKQYDVTPLVTSYSSVQAIDSRMASKSLKFIPFVLERDGVGKLIKSKLDTIRTSSQNIMNIFPKQLKDSQDNEQMKQSRLTQSVRYDVFDSPEQPQSQPELTENSTLIKNDQQPRVKKILTDNKVQGKASFGHKSSLSLIDNGLIADEKNPNYRSLKNFKMNSLICKQLIDLKTRKQFKIEQINRNGLPRSQKQLIYCPQYKDSYDSFLQNQQSCKFRKPISISFKHQSQINLPRLSSLSSSLVQSPTKSVSSIDKICQRARIDKDKQAKGKILNFDSDQRYNAPSLNLQKIKVKVTRQHPELKRFQQMQKLSIKVVSDYAQSHMRFIQKMKNTKINAIKIKQELQLD